MHRHATCMETSAHHAGVEFDGDDFFGLLQQFHGHVTSTRTNLQNHVGALDACLVNNCLHHHRVFQNMLTLALVELQT